MKLFVAFRNIRHFQVLQLVLLLSVRSSAFSFCKRSPSPIVQLKANDPALTKHQERFRTRAPYFTSRLAPTRSRLHAIVGSSASVVPYSLLSKSGTVLVRIVFVRALAFVYGVAFAIALSQNKALIGDDGITPARRVLDQAQATGTFKRHQRLQWRNSGGDRETRSSTVLGWRRYVPHRPRIGQILSRLVDSNKRLLYLREVLWDRSDRADRPVTSLLWLAHDRSGLNVWLDQLAVNGLAMSVAVFVKGAINVPILLAMYLFHRSIMAVGGPWYGYGWEPQLAELGFHALFCVPLFSLDPMHPLAIPAAVRWCIRWHLFRVRLRVSGCLSSSPY